MNHNFINQDKALINFKKSIREGLRKIFSDKITNNFLFEMVDMVNLVYGKEIVKYFNFLPSNESLVKGATDNSVDYEIARNIVGIHRFNMALIDDKERADAEKNPEYRSKLCDDVMTHIRLRNYAGYFFRPNKIYQGEEFLYYPLAYKLFALGTKGYQVLEQRKEKHEIDIFLTEILNKCLSALTLLENNFLDSAYSMCRTAIENFIRMLVLCQNKDVIEIYLKFVMFDVKKNQCEYKENEDLIKAKKHAKHPNTSESDFIHFGWTDAIKDYNPSGKAYSMHGLMDYCKTKYINSIKDFIPLLETLYKKCHSYTHGTIGQTYYPILHYEEVATILYIIISITVSYICDIKGVDKLINGIDVFELVDKDFDNLTKKRSLFSIENFNRYYKINN